MFACGREETLMLVKRAALQIIKKKEKKKMLARRAGLTLVELMICVAIVGIIAAIVIPWALKKPAKPTTPAKLTTPAIIITAAGDWGDTDLKAKMQVVCIDGFEYYFSSVGPGVNEDSHESRAILAPKFDKETALPKRCTAEQENFSQLPPAKAR